jgi:hypothetical protein
VKRRLYFLLPNVEIARQTFNTLLLARIEERRMRFLARDNAVLGDLPEASVLQTTDAVHGLGVGMVTGAMTGALAGGLLMWVQPFGLNVGFGAVLMLGVLGTIMGTWASGIIATAIPNTHLQRFEDEIQRGKILLMVDVSKERMREINELVHRHQPQAELQGHDPTIPAFP